MAFDFISNFVGLFLEDRYKEIENFRLESSDIQSEQLFNLLREAELTEWGKKYDFKTIFSYQDFRERLPIQRANDLQPVLDRLSAGEANIIWPGHPKGILPSMENQRIPLFEQSINETFFQGTNDSYAVYLHQNPDSKLFSGFSVFVGNGSQSYCMDPLMALLKENEPFLSSLLNMPKRIAKEKYRNISTEELYQQIKDEKVSFFKGSPEALFALLEKTATNEDRTNLKTHWPEAEVLFQSGPETTANLAEVSKSLPEGLNYLATYSSPEGFFGIQDNPQDSAYLLMLDLSIFYEFIPVNGTDEQCIPLEDIELNADYQMVVTNCSGLWRYCSGGPKIRFISKSPYRFILL